MAVLVQILGHSARASERKRIEDAANCAAKAIIAQRAKGIYYFLWNHLVFPFFGFAGLGAAYVSRRYFTTGRFHSIRIIDVVSAHDSRFLPMTLEALALIEKYDSRRLRRVLREVRRIDHDDKRMAYTGTYRRAVRSCGVNFQKMVANLGKEDDSDYQTKYEWFVAYYASLIIHEATHGHLFALGFDYDKYTRARSERICVAEQRRFAARIPSQQYDFSKCLVRLYDPVNWQKHWNTTYWQRNVASIKAFREFLEETRAEYR